MTSSMQRRRGLRCLGDIAAVHTLAGGGGDVTHLQAALLSFEPRLREGDGGTSAGWVAEQTQPDPRSTQTSHERSTPPNQETLQPRRCS